MTKNSTLPDLAHHLRLVLEAVTGACGSEGRWGWLAGPMTLLTWIRTRRERRERAEALEQFKALAEAFVALLEDLRAGKLDAPAAPEVHAGSEEAEPTVVQRPAEDVVPPRCSASSAVSGLDRGECSGAQRRYRAPDAEMTVESPPSQPPCQPRLREERLCGPEVAPAERWIPAPGQARSMLSVAGMTDAGFLLRAAAARARAPPDNAFSRNRGECGRDLCDCNVTISQHQVPSAAYPTRSASRRGGRRASSEDCARKCR